MATAVVSPTFKRLSLLIPNFSVRLRTKFYPRAFISKLAKRNSEFGCCWIVVVSCPSSSNNEGKNRGGGNAILAAFVPFKDRYTGNTPF